MVRGIWAGITFLFAVGCLCTAALAQDTTMLEDQAANDTTVVAQETTTPDDQSAAEVTSTPGPNEGCPNPQTVQTFQGSTSQLTPFFEITGDTFRIVYETEVTSNGFPELEVDVEDREGPIGEGFLAFDGEDGVENILAGPGTFRLRLESNRVSYVVTVQDCVAQANNNGNDDTGTNDTGTNDTGTNDDDVMKETISKKPLPPTGGAPLLGLAVGALALVGVGFSVLRTSIRRDP